MFKAEAQNPAYPTPAGNAFAAPEAPGLVAESAAGPLQKTRAVADALAQLGDHADSTRVAAAIKAQTGMEIDAEEVSAIQTKLCERAAAPPEPDQPPPENGRRREPALESLPERP
jgi:hypothetical protein